MRASPDPEPGDLRFIRGDEEIEAVLCAFSRELSL
jgi:hypothetical protein